MTNAELIDRTGAARTGGAVHAKALRHFIVPVSEKTTWIFVQVELEDGTVGVGEASAYGQEAGVRALLDLLAAAIDEHRPALIGPAMALLASRQTSSSRQVVTSAFEQALLDALARRAGLPLATILGGPLSETVPFYANINRGIADRSPAGFAAQARRVVAEEGYRAIKVAPFDGYRWDDAGSAAKLEEGLQRIGAVRDAIGTDIALHIDCHSRLDPVSARTVVRELDSVRPYWIEDPLDDQVFGATEGRLLRDAANDRGIRIAGGESLVTLEQTSRLIDSAACDVILPDLRITGVFNGIAILRLASARGVGVSLHNPAGPVLDAVSRHVAAALPGFLILERQVRETPLYDSISGGGLTLQSGRAALGAGLGHGLVLDQDAVSSAMRAPVNGRVSFAGTAGAGPDA